MLHFLQLCVLRGQLLDANLLEIDDHILIVAVVEHLQHFPGTKDIVHDRVALDEFGSLVRRYSGNLLPGQFHLLDETRWLLESRAVVAGTLRAVRYCEFLARACACHVEQPSLFFDVGAAVQCPAVGKDPFLGTDDEHVAELETLGRVRRDEQDAFSRAWLHAVLVLYERHLRQIGPQRAVLTHPVELIDSAHELPEIFASRLPFEVAFLTFVAVLFKKSRRGKHEVGRTDRRLARRADVHNEIDKCLQLVLGLAGLRLPDPFGQCHEPRRAMLGRQLLQFGEALVAEPPRRPAHCPFERKIVARVETKPEICENILHFLPFVEFQPTDNLIGDIRRKQRFLDDTRLAVHPINDRHVSRIRTTPNQGIDARGDEAGLFLRRQSFEQTHWSTCSVVRPELLRKTRPVAYHQGIRRVEDGLCRPVVLFKLDDRRTWIVLLEPENELAVSATECIYALIIVTDNRDVAVHLRKPLDQFILHFVHILVLVHQNMLELRAVVLLNLRTLVKQPDDQRNKIVEIQQIPLLETLLIELIDSRRRLLDVAIAIVRELFEDLSYKTRAIIFVDDDEPVRVTQIKFLDLLSQDTAAQRVKRANPQSFAGEVGPNERVDARAHLTCCLVGERDGHDVRWGNTTLGDEICELIGDDSGLARARTRKHEAGTLAFLDSPELLWVEVSLEIQRHQAAPPTVIVKSTRTPSPSSVGRR